MTVLLALAVGVLYACGVYLMLRRSVVKLVLGLSLLAHAANLLIFTSGRLVRGAAPIAAAGTSAPPAPFADPVPQALILTAIVIGFGVQAFALVLVRRAWQETGGDDVEALSTTDRLEEDAR